MEALYSESSQTLSYVSLHLAGSHVPFITNCYYKYSAFLNFMSHTNKLPNLRGFMGTLHIFN